MAEPRQIWFFECVEGAGIRYRATDYETTDELAAILTLKAEYGMKANRAVRRELTWYEYRALLAGINAVGGEEGEKIGSAMCGVFFRLEPTDG